MKPLRPLRPVRLWRDASGRAHADVPHYVRHSPTGIEWGYAGSGPSDLAYSILTYFFGEEVAERYAYQLKTRVVARIPRDVREWVIDVDDIRGVLDVDETP